MALSFSGGPGTNGGRFAAAAPLAENDMVQSQCRYESLRRKTQDRFAFFGAGLSQNCKIY